MSGYKLTVSLSEYNVQLNKVWELSDATSSSKAWKFASAPFRTLDIYRVFIDATVGTGDKPSFVAIDDIEFSFGEFACYTSPAAAIPTGQSSLTSTASSRTSRDSIKTLDCDFETPCTWSNVASPRANWTIIKAQDASSIYGIFHFSSSKSIKLAPI